MLRTSTIILPRVPLKDALLTLKSRPLGDGKLMKACVLAITLEEISDVESKEVAW